ncbi:MAG: hypothetical protein EOP83_36725 [Verrucomicrobiaceae bacterium]|nr:MAG: hypothetical protein EOP83_36725 [Verrucomicrobiaceae bacterium]
MNSQPDSIINLSGPEDHVLFCLDTASSAVLTVIRSKERVQSWWSGNTAIPDSVERYRGQGLADSTTIPPEMQVVVDRRWPEIVEIRCEYN